MRVGVLGSVNVGQAFARALLSETVDDITYRAARAYADLYRGQPYRHLSQYGSARAIGY
jgi:hypothetical protein